MAKKCTSDTPADQGIFLDHSRALENKAFRDAKEYLPTGTPLPYKNFDELKSGNPAVAELSLRNANIDYVWPYLDFIDELWDAQKADAENARRKEIEKGKNGSWRARFVRWWRS